MRKHVWARGAIVAAAILTACGGTGTTKSGETTANRTLSVVKAGNGTGTVTGTGVSCGSDCSEAYASGTQVTFTAAADAGSTFASWSGCDSTSSATCTVTANADRTVTATFTAAAQSGPTLTVVKAGTGAGTVSSAPAGIACGVDCSEAYASATSVTLTATAESTSTFASWSGCDSVNGSACTVSVSAAKTVIATFTVKPEVVVFVTALDGDQTFLNGKIYVFAAPIDLARTLTLQAGAVLKFERGAGINVTTGRILATGTAQLPVVLTSIDDDVHGGKAPGSTGTPSPGSWRGVRIAANGSSFDGCQFLYAGEGDTSALSVDELGGPYAVTVKNSIFAHTAGSIDAPHAAAALDVTHGAAATQVTGSTFFDNVLPLAIGEAVSLDDSNAFDAAAVAPSAPQPNRYNVIQLPGCGSVTSSTGVTWAASKAPFIVGNDASGACVGMGVAPGAHLTLGGDVVIKFFPGGHLDVNGILTAKATSGHEVVFTSVKDDAVGGDSDRASAAPAAGDWAGIVVGANGSEFDRANVRYAGAGNTAALVVDANGVNVSVTNSTFEHNGNTDQIDATAALELSRAGPGTIVTGSTFFGNIVPVRVGGAFSTDDSNTFQNGDGSVKNRYNAIFVAGCDQVAGNGITWGARKVAYVIGDPASACSGFGVRAGAHLTLTDDVTVKFFPGGSLSVAGILTAKAAAGHAVVFTSVKDDAHGGDSNGDATGPAPAPGDWDGVAIGFSGSEFDRAEFWYGGGDGLTRDVGALSVDVDGVNVSVTNSTFARNGAQNRIDAAAALELSRAGATTVVTNDTFHGNMVPLRIGPDFSLDDSNTFRNADGSLANTFQGVFIAGCTSVVSAISWSVAKVPLAVGDPVSACNDMGVSGTGHLTLGASLVMKFFAGGSMSIDVNGVLTVAPTTRFTSIKDDLLADTNGDGLSTGSPSDWLGIQFQHLNGPPTCLLDAHVLDHTPHCNW